MTPRQQRRVAAAVVASCLTYVVANLILDQRQGEGPVILAITSHHGVHSGDIPVVVAWVVGVLGCALLGLRGE